MRFFLCIMIVVFNCAILYAQEDGSISRSYPLSGPLDSSSPYIASDGAGVKDVFNMTRPSPGVSAGWKLRAGAIKHNSTTLGAYQIKSLHEFINVDHNTVAFIAQANDNLYLATNDPPATGTTFGSSVYALTAGASPAFSTAVGEDWVGAAAGTYPWAWSGGTAYVDSFLIDRNSDNDHYQNGYYKVRNNDTARKITIVQADDEDMYIGFRRRITGLYLDFISGSTNAVTSGITVYARRAGIWTAVSGLSDGTASGGKCFAQSGLISWTGSASDDAYVLPKTTNHLFWYKIVTSANITDGVEVYRARVIENCQAIENLWSGLYGMTLGCQLSGASGFENWTTEVTDGSEYSYVNIGTQTIMYVGFASPAFGIALQLATDEGDVKSNMTVANTVTVSYWDAVADAWSTSGVSSLDDGTSQDGMAMYQTGVIQWDGSSFEEHLRELGGVPIPLYWYKLTWSVAMPADVYVWDIGQLEKPETFRSAPEYVGAIEFNGRAVYWPGDVYKGGVDYSAQGYAHILNGPDAGTTGNIFGPGEVNGMTLLHSYAVVSTKKPYRLYLLEGKVPGRFDELLISSTIGALASHSLITVEDAVRIFNADRKVHAAIFLASDGVYLTDGMTVLNISKPIQNLFDDSAAPYIETSSADDSYAWIDYSEKTVHIAVPINLTGTGTQSTLNREIVYSYLNDEWHGIVSRAAPSACGMDVTDTNNFRRPYYGDYAGFVYASDPSGTTDSGTRINHYIQTSDFTPLAGQLPNSLNYSFGLRDIKVKLKAKVSGNIDITIYPNGKSTGIDLSNNISMIKSGYSLGYGAIPLNEKGETFSIKFEAGGSVDESMEIYGYTVDFQPVRDTQAQ